MLISSITRAETTLHAVEMMSTNVSTATMGDAACSLVICGARKCCNVDFKLSH
jgi:hypothetical protein